VVFSHYRLSSVPALVGEAPFFHGEHLAAMNERERAICGLAGRSEGGQRL
jgi:hypothetical protein